MIFDRSLNHPVGTAELPRRDEYDRNLRAVVMKSAFQLFVALVLLGIIYAAISSDIGWWSPSGNAQWNGLFWGCFSYASVLPTAVLAFRLRDDEEAA